MLNRKHEVQKVRKYAVYCLKRLRNVARFERLARRLGVELVTTSVNSGSSCWYTVTQDGYKVLRPHLGPETYSRHDEVDEHNHIEFVKFHDVLFDGVHIQYKSKKPFWGSKRCKVATVEQKSSYKSRKIVCSI